MAIYAAAVGDGMTTLTPDNDHTLSQHLCEALQVLARARLKSGVTDVYLMLPAIEECVHKAREIAWTLRDGAEGWQRFYLDRFIRERL